MDQANKLPISAIIVGLDEAHLLEGCFDGITFCDEIIYVDLGSADNSLQIAQRYGATTRGHPLVPSGEYVVASVHPEAKNDWILFIDPDEHLDHILQEDVVRAFSERQGDSGIGSFSAPWQFYFKGKKLHGTPWGMRRPRPFLGHRGRFSFTAETHRGRVLLQGYSEFSIDSEGSIHHFWSSSWRQLISKHMRYLTTEGGSRFRRGDRISLGGVIARVPGIFWETFVRHSDLRDGPRGIGLNLLWSGYKSLALLAVFRYQRSLGRNNDLTSANT